MDCPFAALQKPRLGDPDLRRRPLWNGGESLELRAPYFRFPRAMEDRSDVAVVGPDTTRPQLPLTPDEGIVKGVAFGALAAVPMEE
jgi:hypothetical protein